MGFKKSYSMYSNLIIYTHRFTMKPNNNYTTNPTTTRGKKNTRAFSFQERNQKHFLGTTKNTNPRTKKKSRNKQHHSRNQTTCQVGTENTSQLARPESPIRSGKAPGNKKHHSRNRKPGTPPFFSTLLSLTKPFPVFSPSIFHFAGLGRSIINATLKSWALIMKKPQFQQRSFSSVGTSATVALIPSCSF